MAGAWEAEPSASRGAPAVEAPVELPAEAPAGRQAGAPEDKAPEDEAPTAASPRAAEAMPRKRIQSQQDLEIFTHSRLCEQLLSFISELGEAIRGEPCLPERRTGASAPVQGLAALLDELERWLADFPPLQQPMRFGNRAFCKWHDRLRERGEALLLEAVGPEHAQLAQELQCYLLQSFGDERRIDYGTGHEASFLALLFALGARGVLSKRDACDAVLVVFAGYMRVMRRLQALYLLEPAGSHGVWGLDDFHALPFVLGAAQLDGLEDQVPTGEVFREAVVSRHADSFLYVDAVRQVLLAKRGAPFHETSPMLYDISGVPTWQRTHSGLMKMYRAEVLGKLPVIQHFLFGPTLRWPGGEPPARAAGPPGP